MPEPNTDQNKNLPAGTNEPAEKQTQPSVESQQLPPEMTAEERARKFQLITDDIFIRRAKLMKRLAE